MDRRDALLERARTKGVNPLVYWLARAVLQPFCHLYFRLSRIGREHIPAEGPVILAANHRSFLDPFVIAMLVRRPIYFVAKRELFVNRPVAWLLSSLGAFPIDRGRGDRDAMATAREILERGDAVLIFPEGTRTRPGVLGQPKRGVGRLALETGAPVIPVAIIGSEDVRRGWRIRSRKVRIRAGRALHFPKVDSPSPALARAVTERIWPCVELQWEWLGGLPPLRRAAIVGGEPGWTGLAATLGRAGLDVAVRPKASDLAEADLVVLDVPPRDLPAVLAIHAERIDRGAALLVARDGVVPATGEPAAAYVSARAGGCAVATLGGSPHERLLETQDGDLLAQLRDALQRGGVVVGTAPATPRRRERAA